MAYSINGPIGVIFTAVEDLREIGELTCRSYTTLQVVDLGHIVIGNHNVFGSDLYQWILMNCKAVISPFESYSFILFVRPSFMTVHLYLYIIILLGLFISMTGHVCLLDILVC